MALCTLLLIACDTVEELPAPDKDLIPLAVGNSWTYARADDLGPTDTFSVEITGERAIEIDGRSYHVYEEALRLGGMLPPYRRLVGNERGGFYRYGGVSDEGDTFLRSLNFKYPARKGERYTAWRFGYNPEHGVYANDQVEWMVVATDTLVAVSDIAYICNVYKFRYKPADDVAVWWDVYRYNAPGVGNIIERIYDFNDIYPYEYRLISQSFLIRYNVR